MSETIAPTTSLTQLAREIQEYAIGQNKSSLALFVTSKESVSASEQYANKMGSSASHEKFWNEAAGALNVAVMMLGAASLLGSFLLTGGAFSGAVDSAIKGVVKLGAGVADAGQSVLQGNVKVETAETASMMGTGQELTTKAGQFNGQEAMQVVSALYSANNVVGQAG